MTRRDFLQTTAIFSGTYLLAKDINRDENMRYFMPKESALHKQTWIAFVANKNIWHSYQIDEENR
ncbi:hypothetical protein [Sulfurimonas sp.]|jgi:agmatine deiminase|uniref:hypothetical protein n=1 Tax=Sulfurimonas sp. TaxID=2022749 RepID=UPI0025CD93AE|nr:hypothetical protein [Sulfurimonas sp.]MBT5933941.1 hypothetical protein [Sulfurimonas sp.]